METFPLSVMSPRRTIVWNRFQLKPLRILLDRRDVEREQLRGKNAASTEITERFARPSLSRVRDWDNETPIPRVIKSAAKLKVRFPFFAKAKKDRKGERISEPAEGKDGIANVDLDSGKSNMKGDAGERELDENRYIEPENESEVRDDDGYELDENGNIEPENENEVQDDDHDSDDDSSDDDDNIVKRREKNIADNKRMLREMMAEFDKNAFFKPAAMRRTSTTQSDVKDDDPRGCRTGGKRRSSAQWEQ